MPRSVPQTKVRSTGPLAFPARATASRARRFFTRHESRNTNHGFFVSLFTIVHHCSLLFGIVQQKNCSAPLSSRRPVAAFLRVVERHGAAMARHGRQPSPAPATRPQRFFETRNTKHETRVFSDTHHGFSRSMPFTVVRFAVGAQGTHNRKPPPGPPRLPPGLHVSPRGEAKCVRGPSGLGAAGRRKKARAGVLEQYVEHGKQAQRSPGARIACFDRRVAGKAGYSLLACALWSGCGAGGAAVVVRHGAAYCP